MSEEKEHKIKVPLFKDGEIDQFNKMLDNDLDNFVSKVTKQVLRDKELILMQKVIAKQQKEIEEYKELLDDRLWNEHISKETETIWKNKIKELIKEHEKFSNILSSLIEQSIIIADNDSLNYGRKEAHDLIIRELKELLGEEDE